MKYLSSSLGNMANENNNEEFNQNEGYAIIVKHWGKTVETLQTLMCNMNMMYYFERLKLKFKQFERPGVMPSLVHLGKLMRRCLKLYQMIDSFMNIFKLIKLKEVSIHIFKNLLLENWSLNSYLRSSRSKWRKKSSACYEKTFSLHMFIDKRKSYSSYTFQFWRIVYDRKAEKRKIRLHPEKA